VSSNEAGFNLREIVPLPREYPVQVGGNDTGQPSVGNVCCKATPVTRVRLRADESPAWAVTGNEIPPRLVRCPYQPERKRQVNLKYPAAGQEPQRADGLVR